MGTIQNRLLAAITRNAKVGLCKIVCNVSLLVTNELGCKNAGGNEKAGESLPPKTANGEGESGPIGLEIDVD
jgi:hypothetical protein